MVHRLEEILENDLEEYTYQEDYDVTAIRGNTVKPEREDDVGTTPSIVKHISFHYSNFLKLWHFATKNKTHKKIMATICREFRRRRQRQRRRQVYFKSSTDSGGDCSILLVARTILERQKSGVAACHRSDIKVIKLNGLENTDSQMRIKKRLDRPNDELFS